MLTKNKKKKEEENGMDVQIFTSKKVEALPQVGQCEAKYPNCPPRFITACMDVSPLLVAAYALSF